MLHQVGVSFNLYYDARKHKIKTFTVLYFPLFHLRKTVVSFFAFCVFLGDKIVLKTKQNSGRICTYNTKCGLFIL